MKSVRNVQPSGADGIFHCAISRSGNGFQIAGIRDLPDLGERFFEEVIRNPDLKAVVISKAAERLADAIAD